MYSADERNNIQKCTCQEVIFAYPIDKRFLTRLLTYQKTTEQIAAGNRKVLHKVKGYYSNVGAVKTNLDRKSSPNNLTKANTKPRCNLTVWDDFSLPISQSNLFNINDISSTCDPQLSNLQGKITAKESYSSRGTLLGHSTNINKLQLKRTTSATSLLNKNYYNTQILKFQKRGVCTKKVSINPLIIKYKGGNKKPMLSKQCIPKRSKQSFWTPWIESVFNYLRAIWDPLKSLKSKCMVFFVNNSKVTKAAICKKEIKEKKLNNTCNSNRKQSSLKKSASADCAVTTNVGKLQRKILCKKICNTQKICPPSQDPSTSSFACLQNRSRKDKKNIDHYSSQDENERSPYELKKTIPAVDALYSVCRKIRKLRQDDRTTKICKSRCTVLVTRKSGHGRTICKPCKPSWQNKACRPIRPCPKSLEQSEDCTNTKADLLLTCKNLRKQFGIPDVICKKPSQRDRDCNRTSSGDYTPCFTLERIRAKSKNCPNEETEQSKKWHDEFDKRELLTCQNLFNSCKIKPINETPCTDLRRNTEPPRKCEPVQSECESNLSTAESSNFDFSDSQSCNEHEQPPSSTKNISDDVSTLPKPLPPKDSDCHPKSVNKYLANKYGSMKCQTPKMKTGLSMVPGQYLRCTDKNKNTIAITDIRLENGTKKEANCALLKVRIRIPLSLLDNKTKKSSL